MQHKCTLQNKNELESKQQAMKCLKQQIQFYFSDVNLAVDQKFRTIRNQSQRKWVHITYLLKCRKIREILQTYSKTIDHRSVRRLIAKALKQSKHVKMRGNKIKRNQATNPKNTNKVLYIEGQKLRISIIRTILDNFQSGKYEISMKDNQSWGYIYFRDKTTVEVNKIKQYLHDKIINQIKIKVYTSEEMKQYENKYKLIKQELKNEFIYNN